MFTLVFAPAENAKPGTYAITFDKFGFLDKDISTLTASCTDGAVTLESGDDPGFLLGDVDGDGKVSVEDAQLTLKAYTARIAGKDMNFDARQMKAANINSDDEISVDDAQFILIYRQQHRCGQSCDVGGAAGKGKEKILSASDAGYTGYVLP